MSLGESVKKWNKKINLNFFCSETDKKKFQTVLEIFIIRIRK